MPKPRIFISSTFYDLRYVRSDLDTFFENLGYEPVRNEEGNIPYGKELPLEEYCYKEIKSIDILVSIIGGRFGSQSKSGDVSISQLELKTAQKENKQVYIFIEQNVLAEYETYLLNKENELMKYRYVDDKRIYTFIEEVKNLTSNNNIKGFETAIDISKYLKEQLAGLFQRFLSEQTRIKELNLIRNLEHTAESLNKLVNFLSNENKEHSYEINRILMISHPLVEFLKSELNISYNFYIEKFDDLNEFLKTIGFINDFNNFEMASFVESKFIWKKCTGATTYTINLIVDVFDQDGKLKYYKNNDWLNSYATLEIKTDPNYDDLPF